MFKQLTLIKEQVEFFIPVVEFIFLLFLLILILYFVNKIVRVPKLFTAAFFFLIIDIFLLFPKAALGILKYIFIGFFMVFKQMILLIIHLFAASRLELIIIFNLILAGIIVFTILRYKRKKKKEAIKKH